MNCLHFILGCVNWQPEVEHLLPETLDVKKIFLWNAVHKDNFMFDDRIFILLEETYTQQRFFINKSTPVIEEIKTEWPILLKKEAISFHFEKLMGTPINNLEEAFMLKYEKNLKFGFSKKYITDIPNEITDKQMKCFDVLGRFFNENNEMLIKAIAQVKFFSI